MSGSKYKSSGDIGGTTLLFKVMYCKIKNVLPFVSVCYVFIGVKNIINLYSIVLYSQLG